MPASCFSCGTPLSTTDTDCPACGGHPPAPGGAVPAGTAAAAGPPPRVPGRVATGTVVRAGAVRQEPVIGRSLVVASRTGAALTAAALAVAVVAHAPIGPLLVVCGVAAVVLPLLGAALRSTLPATARRTGTPWWPWVLALQERARARTADVSDLVVKDVTGTEHGCVVTGRLTPAPPGPGTGVEVYGRRDRAGRVVVRQLVLAGTGQVLRPRLSAAGRLTRIAAAATAAAWFAAATALLALATR
ncbi:hypothetical protein [Amycolatopsis sp. NPDC051102]|uniref:hypothetical protein n=1 Tax=Amycolatopsis sp. NPDC051102 TaxID=3155163 RepID=UPI00341549B1